MSDNANYSYPYYLRGKAFSILQEAGWSVSEIAGTLNFKQSYVTDCLSSHRYRQDEREDRLPEVFNDLQLTARAHNAVKKMKPQTLQELSQRLPELAEMQGVGETTINEIQGELLRLGINSA